MASSSRLIYAPLVLLLIISCKALYTPTSLRLARLPSTTSSVLSIGHCHCHYRHGLQMINESYGQCTPTSNDGPFDSQPNLNTVQNSQRLPLQDLLSSARRQALHDDLELIAQEANRREERIRDKLVELGRLRSQPFATTGGAVDVGQQGKIDGRASDPFGQAASLLSANGNNAASGTIGSIIPAATLSGLALFRATIMSREQKGAEVRQNGTEQRNIVAPNKGTPRRSSRRRDGGILGGLMGGAAASLGAFAVSVAPMGVGNAYAQDTMIDNTSIDEVTGSVVTPIVPITMSGFTGTSGMSSSISESAIKSSGGPNLVVQMDAPSIGTRASSTQSSQVPEPKVYLDAPISRAAVSTQSTRVPEPKVVLDASISKTEPASTKSIARMAELSVVMDAPVIRTASSAQSTRGTEPTVVMDENSKMKRKRRPVSPNLNVVMETNPPSTIVTSRPPPPELAVKLEKSIPKKVADPLPKPVVKEGVSAQSTDALPPLSSIPAKVAETTTPPPPPATTDAKVTEAGTASKSTKPPKELVKEDGGKKIESESVRPETVAYIQGYNPKAQSNPTDNAQTTENIMKEKMSTLSYGTTKVLNNAKVFAIGVSVGTVSLITQQKKGRSSSTVAASFDYSSSAAAVDDVSPTNPSTYNGAIDAEGVEYTAGMPQRSYLESLSDVPSVGPGMQQSYLEGLSESSPMEFGSSDVIGNTVPYSDIASFTSINEGNMDSDNSSPTDGSLSEMSSSGSDLEVLNTDLESLNANLETLNADLDSLNAELESFNTDSLGPVLQRVDPGQSYLSSLSRAAPLPIDNLSPTEGSPPGSTFDGTRSRTALSAVPKNHEMDWGGPSPDASVDEDYTLDMSSSYPGSIQEGLQFDNVETSPVEVVLEANLKKRRRRRVRVFVESSAQITQQSPSAEIFSSEVTSRLYTETQFDIPPNNTGQQRIWGSSSSLQMSRGHNSRASSTRLYSSRVSEDRLPPTSTIQEVRMKSGRIRISVSTERFLSVVSNSKNKNRTIRLARVEVPGRSSKKKLALLEVPNKKSFSNDGEMSQSVSSGTIIETSSLDDDEIGETLQSLKQIMSTLDERLNIIVDDEIDEILQSLDKTALELDERLQQERLDQSLQSLDDTMVALDERLRMLDEQSLHSLDDTIVELDERLRMLDDV